MTADIVSNKLLSGPNFNTWSFGTPASDGPLSYLQTGGDLRGVVRASNITFVGGAAISGVFIHGIAYADFQIDLTVAKSSMVARAFLGEIRIGRWLETSVVAVGGAGIVGDIAFIEVGRGPLPQFPGIYYPDLPPGMSGLNTGSGVVHQPANRDDWFDVPTDIDNVIHAENRIGYVSVGSMSLTQFFPSGCTTNPPSIEARHIDTLVIDDLAAGTVWSGDYEADVPAENFAAIDSLTLGCVRRFGAVWAKEWDTAVVLGNLFGDIHVPEVETNRRIQVGGILGDEESTVYSTNPPEEACVCGPWAGACSPCDIQFNYNRGVGNGRDPWYPECDGVEDHRGRVWVHDSEGLRGPSRSTLPTRAFLESRCGLAPC